MQKKKKLKKKNNEKNLSTNRECDYCKKKFKIYIVWNLKHFFLFIVRILIIFDIVFNFLINTITFVTIVLKKTKISMFFKH